MENHFEKNTERLVDVSQIFIEEKSKYFRHVQNIIKAQKKNFMVNCENIQNQIEERFSSVTALLRARQQALKNELTKAVIHKSAAWNRQLSTCDTILQSLKLIDGQSNIQTVMESLNLTLKEQFGLVDSSHVLFEVGEEKIDTSTVELFRPLEGLGQIKFNTDLKLFAPKVIFGTSGQGEGQFCRPWGACTDLVGNIFISDRSNHRVQIFNEVGEFIHQFGREGCLPGELNRPAGIAVNIKNEIIVCDKDNHRIQIFTYSGRLINLFGQQGEGNGEFVYPWGVGVNSNCEIAVTDSKNHRVQLFNEFGQILNIFNANKVGVSRPKAWLKILDSPRGVAFTLDGRLLVTDFNNHHILIISKNFDRYEIIGSAGDAPGQFFRPQDITCDILGRFAVADCKNHRIQVFDANKQLIKILGSHGNDPGKLDCPQGISFHSNGSIVVVDFQNDRVQVF